MDGEKLMNNVQQFIKDELHRITTQRNIRRDDCLKSGSDEYRRALDVLIDAITEGKDISVSK